jgi:NAD(P)H-nitrite reductase large subunit
MSEEHFVVIGNGPAGNQAAETLKEKATEARVTLISKEQEGYYKPCLLPEYMAGKISEDQIYLSTVDAYKEKGIKLRSGQEVVDVKPGRREIVLDHKEVLRFDGLILAVGGSVLRLRPLAAVSIQTTSSRARRRAAREWGSRSPPGWAGRARGRSPALH